MAVGQKPCDYAMGKHRPCGWSRRGVPCDKRRQGVSDVYMYLLPSVLNKSTLTLVQHGAQCLWDLCIACKLSAPRFLLEETFEDQEWWIHYIHNTDTHQSTHLILEFAVISAGS